MSPTFPPPPDLRDHLQDLLERELKSRRRHRALPNDEREFEFVLVTDAELGGLPGPVAVFAITWRTDADEVRERTREALELAADLSFAGLLMIVAGPAAPFSSHARAVAAKHVGPLRLAVWGPDELGLLEHGGPVPRQP